MIIVSWAERQMLILYRNADEKTRRRLHAAAMRLVNHRKALLKQTANDNTPDKNLLEK